MNFPEGLHNRRPAVPWKATDAALATAVLFAGFFGVLLPLGRLAGVFGLEDGAVIAPWFIGLTEGLMLATVWAFGIKKYHARWREVGLRRSEARHSFVLPWLVLLGSLGFTSVYAALATALGVDALRPPSVPVDALGGGVVRALNTMLIVVWGPFAEEVFFRGFLLAALLPTMGALRAVLISSVIFSAAHLSIGAAIPILVTGMLLSWLYLRTQSLWQPLTAHAFQNLIAVSLAV